MMEFFRDPRMSSIFLIYLSLFLTVSAQLPYSDYILAPTSRALKPATVRNSLGVSNPSNLLVTSSGISTFTGTSYVTYDFGKNVGGIVSFDVATVLGAGEIIGFTFTESSQYISAQFCDATQDNGVYDSPLTFTITDTGSYVAPQERLRGGFRYMTVVHNSTGSVSISNMTLAYTGAAPLSQNPATYTGYFNSDSERLNRVWYAGAYTNQMCVVDPNQGSAAPQPTTFWYSNTTLSEGTSVLVDGAKRDRLLWPGDIAVSGPSMYVSIGSFDANKNGLTQLFSEQQSSGQLPYVGKPLGFTWSYTYHLHTLIDVYDYYIFTGDAAFLSGLWSKFKLGLDYSQSTIDSTGLGNVDSSADWLRSGMGGYNIEANSILYYALGCGIELANAMGDTSPVANWIASRNTVQVAANDLLFDSSQNLFKDNTDSTTTLHPQDGNSYALLSGLVNDTTRASAISAALQARWVKPYGAPAPEAGATISPFASGFEIRGHYAAGHAERAVELMEFMWADFMLDDPRMTNSTFIEGYSTDGSLHYAPYQTDARVSHAHGWSTAPTAALTTMGAGIKLLTAAGATWAMKPALGGLDQIKAGFTTSLGSFSASWTGGGTAGNFQTPAGTSGILSIHAVSGKSDVTIVGPSGISSTGFSTEGFAVFTSLAGGSYTVSMA